MKQYYYDGPVTEFDKCIAHRWTGETYAISEKKARSNLIFQFKKQTNRASNAKIKLTGKVILAEKYSKLIGGVQNGCKLQC